MFTLIVTRQLTESEFGSWGLIGGLLLYVVSVDFVISYWVTREIARDVDSGKTAIVSGMILSIGGVCAYLVIAYFVGLGSDVDQNILYFATILIPVMFLNDVLHYMNAGWKPQLVSYGILASEISKVPAGFLLVYIFQMGLEGAIIATMISYVASIMIHLIFGRTKIKGRIRRKYLQKWFKLSWLPLYQSIPNLAFVSDVVIFSVISGSVIGVAYMTAARTISNIVMHASAISDSVYPKLLSGGRNEIFEDNIVKVLYFAIPLLCISIVLARPGLFALNPAYEIAWMIVILTSFRVLLSVFNKMFFAALQGIEKIDLDEKATFKMYFKSKLFFAPTLRVIQYCSYALVLIVVLYTMKEQNFMVLVMYWAIVSLATEIPFLIYQTILFKKHFELKMNYTLISKYFLAAIISFGVLYLLVEEFLDYKISIFDFLPDLLIFTAIGILLYLGTTYAIDGKTRYLFSAILNEIRGSKKS